MIQGPDGRILKNSKGVLSALFISIILLIFLFTIPSFKDMNNTTNGLIVFSLTPDKPSPQNASAIIRWKANASDSGYENETIIYKFLLKGPSTRKIWQDMTGWINDRNWTWATSSNDSGEYEIRVQASEGNQTDADGFYVEKTENFTLTALLLNPPPQIPPKPSSSPNKSPKISALVSDKKSPLSAGSTVHWTANVFDPDKDTIYYKFFLQSPSTRNVWRDMTGWIDENHWTWSTSTNEPGKYEIKVQVRDGNHADKAGFDDEVTQSFVLDVLKQKLPLNNVSIKLSLNKTRNGEDNMTKIAESMILLNPDNNHTAIPEDLGRQPGNGSLVGVEIFNLSRGNGTLNTMTFRPKVPIDTFIVNPNSKNIGQIYANFKYNDSFNLYIPTGRAYDILPSGRRNIKNQSAIGLMGGSKETKAQAKQIVGTVENSFAN